MNTPIRELLLTAPTVVDLLNLARDLHSANIGSPDTRRKWEAAVLRRLVGFIIEAETAEAVTGVLNASMTEHAWPAAQASKDILREAVNLRLRELATP